MSIEFGWAVVPFDEEGHILDLYNEDDTPKEGVILLESGKIDYPGFNNRGFAEANQLVQGTLADLCDGDANQRYVLLANRREQLAKLEEALAILNQPQTADSRAINCLNWLVGNTRRILDEYGSQAALLIY